MLNKKSVDDINVKGQKVLVRCDFNVPLQDGKITDENRLVAALPTIKKLIADGGKVILCSHLGKPKGEPKPELSLAPVAKRLSELLGQEVKFAADPEVVGPNAKAAVAEMKDGDVILLENTRYRAEETKNGDEFSKELASLCDVFVNDAFGTAHRAHCSNVGVTKYVDTAVVGYLMQKEIDFLGNAVNNPERPFVAILGGAKVSSKISVINNLLDKVDTLIIGGGMSYTFSKAMGGHIGRSLCEDDYLQYALDMMKKAEEKGVKLLLPVDNRIGDDFSNDCNIQIVKRGEIPDGWEGMDIGTETEKIFADAVKDAKTVVWNGPMGVFENPVLSKGTVAVAQALADTDATTIIGGGDSAAAVMQLGFADKTEVPLLSHFLCMRPYPIPFHQTDTSQIFHRLPVCRYNYPLILFHFLLFFEIQRNDDRRADDLGRHVSRFHFFYDPLIQHFFVRCMLVDDIQFIFHLYQPVSVKYLPDDLMMFFCFRA